MRLALVLALIVCPLWADNNDCLRCHGNRAELTKALAGKSRRIEPLLVDWRLHERSVHGSESCDTCHADGFEEFPHSKDRESATCADCHEDEAAVHAKSMHGKSLAHKTSCADCHGVHNVFKPDVRDSTLHPLNVHRTCGACHTDGKYVTDPHGHGIVSAGLVVSATCVSCHGGHDIRAANDPESPLARKNVAESCGKCHTGVLEQFRKSVHAIGLKSGDTDVPTCTNCHIPHSPTRVDPVETCGHCHTQRLGTFRNSYHGKVSALGFGDRVADCSSCHGAHDILASVDPLSRVHPYNRVKTCDACHEGANDAFASYIVHADPTDKANDARLWWIWAIMTGLLAGTLVFGCAHALLWLVRALAAGEWRRPKPGKAVMRFMRRWPASYVAYHMALMTIVLTLSITGLPIYFAHMGWAQSLMQAVGGPAGMGYLHRIAAFGLGVLFLIFVIHLVQRLRRGEKGLFFGPDSMVPRVKDLSDLWGNLKWFLFLAPRPKYDRWTYWEKFDFWAAFWGLFVIGITGLMLWFPIETTRFLPGWAINAAGIIHGIEALLDIAFIFSVHVFHANLRPDKFPMDTMFLTGVISEAEFKHERPLEYERAVKEGKLEELLADPPSRRRRITAYVIGTCALAVGFFFVAMMVVAVAEKWAG